MPINEPFKTLRASLTVHDQMVRRIANAVSRYERVVDGKSWTEMDDRDFVRLHELLAARFPKTQSSSIIMNWIRTGLGVLVPDAATRWPGFMATTTGSGTNVEVFPSPYDKVLHELTASSVYGPSALDAVKTVVEIAKRTIGGHLSWDGVSDEDMRTAVLDAIHSKYSASRYRTAYRALRTVLERLHADCRTRWPILYSSYKLKRPIKRGEGNATSCSFALVEKQLRSMCGRDVNLTQTILDAINSGVVTMAMPGTFYDAENRVIPAALRAFVLLRWDDHADVVALFRTMARYADALEPINKNYQLGLVNVTYHIFAAVQPHGGLIPALEGLTRPRLVEALRGMKHYRAHVTCALTNFSTQGPFASLFPNIASFPVVQLKEIGYTRHSRERSRDSFTLDEVKTIMAEAEKDARDHAMFCFYMHTGCRSRAGTLLKVSEVWDADRRQVRPSGRVLEKKGKTRVFQIDPTLAAAFQRHIEENKPGALMFTMNGAQMSTDNVSFWFKRLVHTAGITGDHVHVHALRHTFVTLLLKDGNRIEDISRIIDHESVAMTQYYVDRSALQEKMSIPWLRSSVMSMPTVDNLPPPTKKGAPGSKRSSQSSGSEVTIQNLLAANRLMMDKMSEMTRVFNFIQTSILTPVQQDQLATFRQHCLPDRGSNESSSDTSGESSDG